MEVADGEVEGQTKIDPQRMQDWPGGLWFAVSAQFWGDDFDFLLLPTEFPCQRKVLVSAGQGGDVGDEELGPHLRIS